MNKRDRSHGSPSSRRVNQLRSWFNLDSAQPPWNGSRRGAGQQPPSIASPESLLPPAPGQILLITGPSGSGKSRLLATLRRRVKAPCIDLQRIRLPRRAVADLFSRLSTLRALRLLARVGLAEAHSFIAMPCQLSVGQRWRLRLAVALEQLRHMPGGATLLCDEFAAPLDCISTAVVCRLLRKQVTRSKLSAIVVSARDDLATFLQPDLIAACDFGRINMTSFNRQSSSSINHLQGV